MGILITNFVLPSRQFCQHNVCSAEHLCYTEHLSYKSTQNLIELCCRKQITCRHELQNAKNNKKVNQQKRCSKWWLASVRGMREAQRQLRFRSLFYIAAVCVQAMIYATRRSNRVKRIFWSQRPVLKSRNAKQSICNIRLPFPLITVLCNVCT